MFFYFIYYIYLPTFLGFELTAVLNIDQTRIFIICNIIIMEIDKKEPFINGLVGRIYTSHIHTNMSRHQKPNLKCLDLAKSFLEI